MTPARAVNDPLTALYLPSMVFVLCVYRCARVTTAGCSCFCSGCQASSHPIHSSSLGDVVEVVLRSYGGGTSIRGRLVGRSGDGQLSIRSSATELAYRMTQLDTSRGHDFFFSPALSFLVIGREGGRTCFGGGSLRAFCCFGMVQVSGWGTGRLAGRGWLVSTERVCSAKERGHSVSGDCTTCVWLQCKQARVGGGGAVLHARAGQNRLRRTTNHLMHGGIAIGKTAGGAEA